MVARLYLQLIVRFRDVEGAIPYRNFKLLFFLILTNSKLIDTNKTTSKTNNNR